MMSHTVPQLPPLCRRKLPAQQAMADTFRVIRDDPGPNYDTFLGLSPLRCNGPSLNILGQPVQQMPENEMRNRPCPGNLVSLMGDVRIMMAPVLHTRTRGADPECGVSPTPWWEHPSSLKPGGIPSAPPRTLDSTARNDYQYRGSGIVGSTRHGCNTYNNPAAVGAPLSFTEEGSGKKLFWKEGISYEHNYNCRNDPNYPVRGRRHGSFIWQKMPSADVDQMLAYYGQTKTDTSVSSSLASDENCRPPPLEVPHEQQRSRKSSSCSAKSLGKLSAV